MEKEAKSLLVKYKTGLCTPAEKAIVERWYYQLKDEAGLDENRIDEIGHEIWSRLPLNNKAARKYHLWYRIAAAASIVLVFGVGFYFYRNVILNPKDNAALLSLSKHDVAPGTNKAILTLANGKVIILSDAKTGIVIKASKLVYSDGTKISDSAIRGRHPELVSGPRIIQTPRGGTYQVILPDGTHIWLNAASSIKFPASFASLKERKVELTGEAYFAVKHNTKQPFRVQTKGQIVEDIGTEFNITSYADETTTKTTLIEGSARVLYTSRHSELVSEPRNRKAIISDNNVVLKPGQQSILTGNNRINIQEVDVEQAIAWKNGDFIFRRESLDQLMHRVSRWYDIEVVYAQDVDKEQTFSGQVSRTKNISEVLNSLQSTGLLRFKIEGKKVTVMK